MQVVGEISNGITTVSKDIEGEIMTIAGDAQNVGMNLKSDATAIGGSIMELGGEIKSASTQVVDGAKQTLLTVGKDVEGAFATVKADGMKVKGDIEALSWQLKNLDDDAKSFCMTAKQKAGDAVYTLGNSVKGTLTEIAGKFKAGTLTFEDLTQGLTQICHSVGDAAKEFYQIYQEGKEFVQKYADAVKLIYTGATHAFTNLRQNFQNLKGDIIADNIGGIEAAYDGMKTSIKHIADKVECVAKTVNDGAKNVQMGGKTFIDADHAVHHIQTDIFNVVVQTKGAIEHGINVAMDGASSVINLTSDTINMFEKDINGFVDGAAVELSDLSQQVGQLVDGAALSSQILDKFETELLQKLHDKVMENVSEDNLQEVIAIASALHNQRITTLEQQVALLMKQVATLQQTSSQKVLELNAQWEASMAELERRFE